MKMILQEIERPPSPTVERPPSPTVERPPKPTVEKPPKPGAEKQPKKDNSDYPKDKVEGDKFRAWVNDTFPDYAKEIKLDRTGSYNNNYIKKAWAKYKKEYTDFIGKGGKVVVGTANKFPVNDIEVSNMFREWVSDNHSGYIQKNQAFKPSITDPKEIADDTFKKAWFEYGNDYIYYLTSNPNGALSSIGTKLSKDYEAWKKSDEAKMSGLELQRRDREFQKKKCEPWESGNLISRTLPSSNDSDKNSFAEKFIEWADSEGYIDLHLPSQFCGEDKSSGIQWVYQDWVDDNNKSYPPYEHPIVRYMSLLPMWVYDEVRGVDTKSNLFNKFLKLNKKEVKTNNSSNNTNTGTKGTSTVSTTNVVKTNPNLLSAAKNVERNLSRQNCRTLSSEVKKVGGSTTDNFINIQITKCKRNYPGTFNESIENKITGKLKLMKENKSLNESVINKIKSKKNEKALSTLSEQFNKQNYRKFFDTLTKLKNNNISEATNTEFEKSFDVIFQGKETEFKNRAIEYILNKLEVSPTSTLGMNIKSELDKTSAKDMFRYESAVPEAVSNAVEKSSQSNNSEQTGLKNIVSQAIKFDDKEIKQGVRQHLHDYIEGVKDDIKSLEQKLKSSIIRDI
jgi:hypothetical protein